MILLTSVIFSVPPPELPEDINYIGIEGLFQENDPISLLVPDLPKEKVFSGHTSHLNFHDIDSIEITLPNYLALLDDLTYYDEKTSELVNRLISGDKEAKTLFMQLIETKKKLFTLFDRFLIRNN